VIDEDAVWITNLDGTHRERITSAGGADPNVSPNGQTVSFLGDTPDDLTALFAVGLDGSDVHQVTPALYGIALKHDWAPDCRRLVFTDNADNPGKPAKSPPSGPTAPVCAT
jgi:Tol biopolymer transport system component